MKTYETGKVSVHALRGVGLKVAKGEMVAVMGPSGCGKTTLLNCLSGLDEITQGKVLIEGVPLHELSDHERTRYRAQRMGFVFQFFNLLPVLYAEENVELPLLVAGMRPTEARQRAREALDWVGLSQRASQRPSELSGGEQQRVAVARALINDPAIVWADEPTGNLDSETAQSVMDLLCRLNRERNTTFIVVTHDPAVGSMAKRIVRMRDGQVEQDKLNIRA
jgi:putative ABC transport system ATP-binding protein